jgi:hypothetical protein
MILLMMDKDNCEAVGRIIGRETEVLEGNLPQCRFVHHKSHVTWPGLEIVASQWEAAD